MRKCPHCSKKISDTARKCKFCGERVVDKNGNQIVTFFTFNDGPQNEEPLSKVDKIVVGSIAGFVLLLFIGSIILMIIM